MPHPNPTDPATRSQPDDAPSIDTHGRPLRTLRVSVTDRCNLRCQYCMPEEAYVWLPRRDLLSFEEIARLVDAFIELGVDRVRLTGGEPLLRRDLPVLVEMLARRQALEEIAMTTNGVLLEGMAAALRDAGLDRITISLDSLRPERYRALAKRNHFERTLAGIEAARRTGFTDLKTDTVVIRGFNDDELAELIEFGRTAGLEVRFIEYMDVGGATRWSWEQVLPRAEMLERLASAFGPITPLVENGSAPADRFRLADGTIFGIISSTTTPFCHSCDRSRLTADGIWYLCLYAEEGVDLRSPLRDGATDAAIRDRIAGTWRARTDRGAEARKDVLMRGALHEAGTLRSKPHLEMHTRGG